MDALRFLHDENLVHTGMIVHLTLYYLGKAKDVKLDDIFVNLQLNNDDRFAEIQLGDLGGCVPADSEWATSGTQVGTPM